MKEISIQAFSIKLSQKELMKRIPKGLITKIKSAGTNPFFQAYSIIHEGISRPRIIGEGHIKIAWPRQAVNTVKGLITKGLQFFIGHNKDNSTRGRRALGKVITDFQKIINGKLHHIVIGHFPNRRAALDYDVCSIEADADFQEVDGISFAQRVHKITGIALGSSNEDSPAFPGAVRLATLQAFGPDDDTNNNNKKKEGDSTMTFEDIKRAVRDMNIWPHQLFDLAKLSDDTNFGKIVKGYDKYKEDIEKLNNTIIEKDELIAKANKQVSLVGIKATFKTLIPEGSTEKQKEFFNKRFKPEEMEDISEEALKKFIEKTQEEYKDMASVFGTKEKEKEDKNNSSDDDTSNMTEDEILDEITNDTISST